MYRSRSRRRKRCSSFRFSSRFSSSQRDFFSTGARPSRAMRRASPARTSSSALFILATMWKRSRICSASEHLSRMTFRYGSHHVRADEYDLGDDFFPDGSEESLKGFDGSFLAHPGQAGDAEVDLINQCQILVPFEVLDFIDADSVDL